MRSPSYDDPYAAGLYACIWAIEDLKRVPVVEKIDVKRYAPVARRVRSRGVVLSRALDDSSEESASGEVPEIIETPSPELTAAIRPGSCTWSAVRPPLTATGVVPTHDDVGPAESFPKTFRKHPPKGRLAPGFFFAFDSAVMLLAPGQPLTYREVFFIASRRSASETMLVS